MIGLMIVKDVTRVGGLRRDCKVSGFGLIELMISLAIASFLVLGLMIIAGNTQSTYVGQSELAEQNDKKRFAAVLFGQAIQTAGYTSYIPPTPAQLLAGAVFAPPAFAAVFPTQTANNFLVGQYIGGTTGSSNTTPDTLNVRFYFANGDSNPMLNCQGMPASATGVYQSQFAIVNNNLVCSYSNSVGAAFGNQIVLIDGVTNMKVLYGVDTTGAVGSATQYIPASVMTASNWANVRSVKISLTFKQILKSVAATNNAYTLIFQVMYENVSTSPT